MDLKPHAVQGQQNFSENQSTGESFDYPQKEIDSQEHLVSKKSFSTKAIFGLFLFLGVSTLVFGFFSLYQNIYGPFDNFAKSTVSNQESDEQLLQNILKLQQLDTDGDGLTDYDEEYVYGTSPYLADTDSDGYSDKQEIDSNNDPLCPAGMDCRGFEQTTQGTTDLSKENNDYLENNQIIEQPPIEIDAVFNDLTADQVRQLLLESGQMSQEELDQVDDETLMQVVAEILNE